MEKYTSEKHLLCVSNTDQMTNLKIINTWIIYFVAYVSQKVFFNTILWYTYIYSRIYIFTMRNLFLEKFIIWQQFQLGIILATPDPVLFNLPLSKGRQASMWTNVGNLSIETIRKHIPEI